MGFSLSRALLSGVGGIGHAVAQLADIEIKKANDAEVAAQKKIDTFDLIAEQERLQELREKSKDELKARLDEEKRAKGAEAYKTARDAAKEKGLDPDTAAGMRFISMELEGTGYAEHAAKIRDSGIRLEDNQQRSEDRNAQLAATTAYHNAQLASVGEARSARNEAKAEQLKLNQANATDKQLYNLYSVPVIDANGTEKSDHSAAGFAQNIAAQQRAKGWSEGDILADAEGRAGVFRTYYSTVKGKADPVVAFQQVLDAEKAAGEAKKNPAPAQQPVQAPSAVQTPKVGNIGRQVQQVANTNPNTAGEFSFDTFLKNIPGSHYGRTGEF